jgi:lysophospholipid acyltransferase (LPLAT)-like uncharacterized protein
MNILTQNQHKINTIQYIFKIFFIFVVITYSEATFDFNPMCISPKTIQMWLGHSKVEMTMNTYVDGRALIVGVSKFTQSEIGKFNAKKQEKDR